MKSLDASYAPPNWWPWWARGITLIGEDDKKAAYASVQLRRIDRVTFARCLRPPFNWGKGAYLLGADLRGAYLTRANLTGADLTGANLTWANLTWAYLSEANHDESTIWPDGFTIS